MVTNNAANYATGASGTVLTGNGMGVTPTFQTPAGFTPSIFSAVLSSTATNQTGNNAAATVVCDTALINIGSNYNTSTGVYTAPATGSYVFNGTVYVTSLTTAMTEGSIWLSVNSASRAWQGFLNPAAVKDNSHSGYSFTLNAVMNLSANDAITLVIQVGQGAANSASFMSAGTSFPWVTFSGQRIS